MLRLVHEMNSNWLKRVSTVGAVLVMLVAFGQFPELVKAENCSSLAECTQLQQQLKLRQLAADASYKQNSNQASNLRGVVQDIQGDIYYTEGRIANTESQIALAEKILSQLSADIIKRQDRMAEAYVSLYEMSRTSPTGIVFSSSINDALIQAQYLQSIQTQLQAQLVSLKESQDQRETQRQGLEAQRRTLSTDRLALSNKKSQQTYLLSVAQSNASYYKGLSKEIQQNIAEVERKMSVLIAQASWGSDIVSVQQGSWYFSQLDPAYSSTRLGNSPYTVGQYGCLITSIAMVSTFNGKRVTPSQIARYPGNFDYGGYLTKLPPSPTSFSTFSTSPINWATVNSELDSGFPVMVSIYIPAVGVINGDGSSHFIVLYGRSSGKYIMHDPLGPGRSYAANQVRSMIITRK
ncbi:hypothetical protein A3A71_03435 [Candidatus Berkelbacteria bacterium RIFCSPLOWO2_01_FULL_50_28]|uniref:Peptidase C39-like domain-containing protein n=1 Tax=Candidatus Berkelbacteria bacterium RIFCSPLOWO2_01_FULL_50_28 TaxID=1797471 RepID=A0A1F5ECU0_9BACT|nr:MAG: hypothetical protein A2807_03000 [Candidatus Berkelbacteria bacterium RIFCSPHIGHO2_01_FULL_50_36]OGD65110.1 MAG: hypothetical protein A3A71_03435 [Candidatus Berkelbacteria bacterium RIFCSPLOWO2_01_FULL_50_28]